MFIVIFKAELKQLDDEYYLIATQLRELAFNQFNCIDLYSLTDNNKEVTLSYWHDQVQILAWKNYPLHQEAQRLGKEHWYKSYQVEIVELKQTYSFNH